MEQNEKKQSLENMLKKASQQLGTDSESLKKAASEGKLNELLKNLDSNQAENLSKILSDKTKTAQILSSPKAKQLFKKFFGG